MDIATRHHLLFSELSPIHINGVAGEAIIFNKGIGGHIGHIIPKVIIKPSPQGSPLDGL